MVAATPMIKQLACQAVVVSGASLVTAFSEVELALALVVVDGTLPTH